MATVMFLTSPYVAGYHSGIGYVAYTLNLVRFNYTSANKLAVSLRHTITILHVVERRFNALEENSYVEADI
jgi:hypothetical protein